MWTILTTAVVKFSKRKINHFPKTEKKLNRIKSIYWNQIPIFYAFRKSLQQNISYQKNEPKSINLFSIIKYWGILMYIIICVFYTENPNNHQSTLKYHKNYKCQNIVHKYIEYIGRVSYIINLWLLKLFFPSFCFKFIYIDLIMFGIGYVGGYTDFFSVQTLLYYGRISRVCKRKFESFFFFPKCLK